MMNCQPHFVGLAPDLIPSTLLSTSASSDSCENASIPASLSDQINHPGNPDVSKDSIMSEMNSNLFLRKSSVLRKLQISDSHINKDNQSPLKDEIVLSFSKNTARLNYKANEVDRCTPKILSSESQYFTNSQRPYQGSLFYKSYQEPINRSNSESNASNTDKDFLSLGGSPCRSGRDISSQAPFRYLNVTSQNVSLFQNVLEPDRKIDHGLEHVIIKRGNRWPCKKIICIKTGFSRCLNPDRWVARHLCSIGTTLIYHKEQAYYPTIVGEQTSNDCWNNIDKQFYPINYDTHQLESERRHLTDKILDISSQQSFVSWRCNTIRQNVTITSGRHTNNANDSKSTKNCSLCRKPYAVTARGVKAITPDTACFIFSRPYENQLNCVFIFEWCPGSETGEGIWPVGSIPKTLSDQGLLAAFARAPMPKWIFSCSSLTSAKQWKANVEQSRKLAQTVLNVGHALYFLPNDIEQTVAAECTRTRNPYVSFLDTPINIITPPVELDPHQLTDSEEDGPVRPCRQSLLNSYEFGSPVLSTLGQIQHQSSKDDYKEWTCAVFHMDTAHEE